MGLNRIIRSMWEKALNSTKSYSIHRYLFPSYWHCMIYNHPYSCNTGHNYFSACPNRGAGIGHQMSNWHSGYWWSQYFGLKFAHTPFAQSSWERFLGYGLGEKTVPELKSEGYRIVRIPMFDEFSPSDMELTKRIIGSYANEKVIFYAEQDQSYHDQIGVIPFIREKFYSAPARDSDLTPFDDRNFNIAVHVRRGDITIGQLNGDPNLTMRWLDNEYFEHILDQVIPEVKTDKPIHVYLFSQGKKEDFQSFEKYPNLHLFLDLNPESTFLSFVYADMLITSKSSFSYKPALLNTKGVKVCPQNFWHSYPDETDWVLADDCGRISEEQLAKLKK